MGVKKNLVLVFSLLTVLGCNNPSNRRTEEKYMLRWAGYGYPVYDKFRSEESKKFEQIHPEVSVRYEPIPKEYRSKILMQLASGTAPDMFFAFELSEFITKGTLVDITAWVKRDAAEFVDVLPSLMEAHLWDGKYYALPGNCCVDVLYYNKDIFDTAGMPYPDENWTWDEMLIAAKKLTLRDPQGKVISFGLSFGISPMLFVMQNGGRIWDEKETRCIINSPESMEALQFYSDLLFKHKVIPTKVEEEQLSQNEFFIMGKSAMYLGNSWEVATFKIRNRGGHKLNWDATIPPQPRGKPECSGLAYLSLGVWSKGKRPELAYELAKFMMNPERIRFLVEVGDSLPVYRNGIDMDYYLKDSNRPEKAKREMLKALEYARSLYRESVNPGVPYLQQKKVIDEGIEKIANGIQNVPEILKEMERYLNAFLSK